MRLNIQGWNSLALDGMPLDRELDVATYAIFEKHLGPIRARALSEIAWFWISSGEKRARPSRGNSIARDLVRLAIPARRR